MMQTNEQNRKIIVGGHICLDITPQFTSDRYVPAEKLLSPGKLLEMSGATLSLGGAVSNTGLGLKVLGADVSLMGKVGDDEFGSLVQQKLAAYGAQNDIIVEKGGVTSYTVVIAPPGVDRIFLHSPGANHTFSLQDLDFDKIAKARLFHFGYPPLMRKLFEENGKELTELFRRVKALGVITSLDMAMVDENTPAGKADWRGILQRTLPFVDVFVPSVEETLFMLQPEKYSRLKSAAGSVDLTQVLSLREDIAPLAQELLDMGAKAVLLKCGVPGIYLALGQTELEMLSPAFAQNPGFAAFMDSFTPTRVASGTGAGDTSIAAFLKALVDGESPQQALTYAAATGACCVEAFDTVSGLRPFTVLQKKIAAGWPQQHLVRP